MDEELRQVLETLRQENAAAHGETRRHFEILSEGLRHELRLVAEGVGLLAERLEQLHTDVNGTTEGLDRRLTRLEAASPRR